MLISDGCTALRALQRVTSGASPGAFPETVIEDLEIGYNSVSKGKQALALYRYGGKSRLN